MQLVVLFWVLFDGPNHFDFEKKTEKHYTMVFNTFVFLQVFNEVNARQVTQDKNVFNHIIDNHIMHVVTLVIVGFQYLLVEHFGAFSHCVPQDYKMWLVAIALGSLSIPWGAIVRLVYVDDSKSMITLDPDTFEGADLTAHDDEVVHV